MFFAYALPIAVKLDSTCAKAIKAIAIQGYITHFYWGCNAGNHTGIMIADAESEEEIRNTLSPIHTDKARVIKLNTFTADEVKAMHQDHGIS
ncbi:MAG: hypothetical protein IIA45_00710 [Bacteroidetes bacterium]|nr:hypothetical protein [Bacteroidota bacterium]